MVLYTSFSALAASPSWPLRTWTRTKSTRGACIWLCLINVLHQCGWTYALFLVTNLYYGWIILANLVNVSSFRKNVICKFELSWAVLLCPWICLIICWMCPWMCYCVQSVCPVMNNLRSNMSCNYSSDPDNTECSVFRLWFQDRGSVFSSCCWPYVESALCIHVIYLSFLQVNVCWQIFTLENISVVLPEVVPFLLLKLSR